MLKLAVIPWIVGYVWISVRKRFLGPTPEREENREWQPVIGLFFPFSLRSAPDAWIASISAHIKLYRF
jgi:hypothetical protein